jgi:hypothetical protein
MKPKKIADALCIKEGIRTGSITSKDVSNFKKSGILKTHKVSLTNNNLRADDGDNCM